MIIFPDSPASGGFSFVNPYRELSKFYFAASGGFPFVFLSRTMRSFKSSRLRWISFVIPYREPSEFHFLPPADSPLYFPTGECQNFIPPPPADFSLYSPICIGEWLNFLHIHDPLRIALLQL